MKKFLALIIAVAMIFAMAACATTTTPSASPTEEVTTSVAPTEAATPTDDGVAGPEVLQDVRVRQALSLAIDRDYLNQTVWNGTRTPAYTICSGGIPDATPGSDFRQVGGQVVGGNLTTDLTANVAKAKELLAEAGFPDGAGFPILEFAYNTNTGHQAVGEAVQQMWADNLGISVKLSSMEWDVFQGYRKTNACQLARQGWLGDYTDPSTFFDLFTSTAGTNDGHYNNPEYDTLVNSARTEPDVAKRMQMYHDAEKIFMDDAGCIPVVFYADDVLSQTDFTPYDAATGTGYAVTGTGMKSFWNASKAEPSVCVGAQPETLDPTMNQSVDGMIYINHLYEGLYRLNLDGSFSYGQAKDIKVEGNKITVELRDDIFWSDGKPVTSDNFIYSWQRLCDPAVASPYSYLAETFFANGADVIAGNVAPKDLSVTKIDDKHFSFEVTGTVGYMKDLLAFPNFMPLRQDVIEAGAEGWATTTSFPTNGRYTLAEFANEDQIVMAKSDTYWDKDSTKSTKITFKLMSDDNAMLAAFDAKELDLIDSMPTDELARLMTTPEYHRFPNLGIYYLQINNIAH